MNDREPSLEPEGGVAANVVRPHLTTNDIVDNESFKERIEPDALISEEVPRRMNSIMEPI